MRNNIELRTCPHCIPDLEHSGHRCQVCDGTGEIYEYQDDGPMVGFWILAAGMVAIIFGCGLICGLVAG